MSSTYIFADPRLDKLDGFQVEIDEAHERADIILNRPPYNVVSMPQRDQLRLVFETFDEDVRIRIIVVRSVGEHFSSGGNISGFMEATPETVSKLAWNIASPTRCSKPVIVANRGYCFGVGFELSLACDFRVASETTLYALPEQKLGQIPGFGRFGAPAEDDRHYPHQGYRDAFKAHFRKTGIRLGHRDRMRARCRTREGDQ
jgi:2-oxoglutaroyl-CoA hydrolase